MRFIIDAQLPPGLAQWLADIGHEADHVDALGLREAEDSPIWNYALENGAVLITKDEDFALRGRQNRRCPVVVWLRVGNCFNQALKAWFSALFPAVLKEIENGNRLIEVR